MRLVLPILLSLLGFIGCSSDKGKEIRAIKTESFDKKHIQLIQKYIEYEDLKKSPQNRTFENKLLRLLVHKDISILEELERRVANIEGEKIAQRIAQQALKEEKIEDYLKNYTEGQVFKLSISESFTPYNKIYILVKNSDSTYLNLIKFQYNFWGDSCNIYPSSTDCFKLISNEKISVSKEQYKEIYQSIFWHSNIEYSASDSDLQKHNSTDCRNLSLQVLDKSEYSIDKFEIHRHCPGADSPLAIVAEKIMRLAK